ncbi:MAG TPA: NADPH-dependent FMN reductase [Chitinophaga sp.]|uniref:NADPH-dependent FMN reductase n=1 Tax=Chitinophaga sp. TaxID=1869181 RepID=UPI002DBDADE6|nr:NADPH-dependent FMN reductase [Chitinophaga sp.]HEU4551644.1 NADPH-dependent FMN reductase [Chitinophaga sp.]
MKIAIISSSIRQGRRSHGVALALENKIQALSAHEAFIIDLADAGTLPANIGSRLATAAALLFVSPEYHGGYAAALKRATEEADKRVFINKPIGAVSVSAGQLGGIRAALQMQQLILALHGFPLPTMLLVPVVQEKIDLQGAFINPAFEETTTQYVQKFLWLAEAIDQKKQDMKAAS